MAIGIVDEPILGQNQDWLEIKIAIRYLSPKHTYDPFKKFNTLKRRNNGII